MKKLNRIMEGFWLAVAAVSLGLAIWAISTQGFGAGKIWLWFPLVALGMWFGRRLMRKKIEAMEERDRMQGK